MPREAPVRVAEWSGCKSEPSRVFLVMEKCRTSVMGCLQARRFGGPRPFSSFGSRRGCGVWAPGDVLDGRPRRCECVLRYAPGHQAGIASLSNCHVICGSCLKLPSESSLVIQALSPREGTFTRSALCTGTSSQTTSFLVVLMGGL